jgi:outer membrane protein with beta-barrel domain
MRSPSTVLPSFLILASLVLGASPAFAQAPAAQQPPPPPRATSSSGGAEGFGFQIGGGPLFANFTDAQGLESKAGWLVGVLMGGNRSGTVGVEADVLYGKRGVTVPIFGSFDQRVVHVPVMLKINGGSPDREGLSFFGVGGGYFDWQFSGKLGNVDISEDTDGYEVGWVVGAGVEVLRVSGQVRFMRGIRQIGKNFDVARSVDSESKAVVVLVAFRLN